MESHDHQSKEEDVFFMDIEKSILLLVNDDEEAEAAKNRHRLSGNSVKRQSLSPLILEEMNHFSTWRHDNEREQLLCSKQRNRLSHVWLPRESNGTGVFIPNHPTASKTRSCEDGGVRKSTSQPLQGRRHLFGRVPCTQ